ncbi:hypothetical protein COCON_G00055540 [Conger conger]|uniref:Uncharacterized protein n=1 Tax=Conger conger TaxID=82655 RepID=A0A9Q1I604_CONCO|nr:hypothetical protein COCON_G00055540 [Conger conger]
MQLEGSARRFAAVDPKGLKSTTKPAALKAAKQNSSLVAKIKTKIQNTSSFFKVSLKTNNKALALALVAQKDKSRLLETETVRLRKEVQSLCFDLAHHRHQHNRLVRLLKDLQASALHSIVAAVDLLSAEGVQDSSDAPEEINEKSQTHPEDAITELGRVPGRVPVVSEKIGNTPRPSPKKPTRESSGSSGSQDQLGNPSEEIHSQTSTATLHRVIGQGSTCNEDTETVAESIPPRKEKIARPSSGLQQELDKWSRIYLDIQLEPEPIPEPLAVVNSPPLPESLPEPASVEPKGTSGGLTGESPGPERTTLFESEMEITLGEPLAEIVAVETKPKKSRKESVAKSQRKEGTQADGTRPPDKEEREEEEEEEEEQLCSLGRDSKHRCSSHSGAGPDAEPRLLPVPQSRRPRLRGGGERGGACGKGGGACTKGGGACTKGGGACGKGRGPVRGSPECSRHLPQREEPPPNPRSPARLHRGAERAENLHRLPRRRARERRAPKLAERRLLWQRGNVRRGNRGKGNPLGHGHSGRRGRPQREKQEDLRRPRVAERLRREQEDVRDLGRRRAGPHEHEEQED